MLNNQNFNSLESACTYIILLEERIKLLEENSKMWEQKYKSLNDYYENISLALTDLRTIN